MRNFDFSPLHSPITKQDNLTYGNFTIQRQDLAPRFKVFSLHGQPWQKIIPAKFQKDVLQIKQPIDIEIDGAFVIFYAANKFNLKLLPQLFQ